MSDCLTYVIINLLWLYILSYAWMRERFRKKKEKGKERKEKQSIKMIKYQNWLSIFLGHFQSQLFLRMNSPYSPRKAKRKKIEKKEKNKKKNRGETRRKKRNKEKR